MSTDPIIARDQWMKLSSIVDMCCQRLGLSVPHYFQLLLGFGKWELINLRLDRAQEVKTFLLPISDVFTCQCPPELLDITKIGIPFGQYVKTIGINDSLSKIDRTPGNPDFCYSVSPGSLPNGVAIQEYGGGFEFMNYDGRALFGIGGGLPHEGHYQIKKCAGGLEILLDGNIGCDQIYVEGICIGLNPCGETVVDPYIADYVLKAILRVWEEERNPKRTEASIRRRATDQAYAFSLIAGRTNTLSVDDMLNITRRSYRLTAKA